MTELSCQLKGKECLDAFMGPRTKQVVFFPLLTLPGTIYIKLGWWHRSRIWNISYKLLNCGLRLMKILIFKIVNNIKKELTKYICIILTWRILKYSGIKCFMCLSFSQMFLFHFKLFWYLRMVTSVSLNCPSVLKRQAILMP